MPKIVVDKLTVGYQNKKQYTPVFDNFSVEFPSNKITVILGESGCGKTTLLHTIAGLLPYEGNIYFGDKEISELSLREKNVAYVNQDFVLYPTLTIFDNIGFPLRFAELETSEKIFRVREIAKTLGIEQCLTRRPKQISIGQQQRVAIARALVKDPEICLFDEPFSNLDLVVKGEIRHLLKKIMKELDATTIFVTHDYFEAFSLADKVIVIADNKIVFEGTPKEMDASKNEYLEALRKSSELDEVILNE